METITIKVDPEVAKLYQKADSNKQEKINTILKLFLQSDFADKSLSDVMSEISHKAEKRGLTPEILEDILNDNE